MCYGQSNSHYSLTKEKQKTFFFYFCVKDCVQTVQNKLDSQKIRLFSNS